MYNFQQFDNRRSNNAVNDAAVNDRYKIIHCYFSKENAIHDFIFLNKNTIY